MQLLMQLGNAEAILESYEKDFYDHNRTILEEN